MYDNLLKIILTFGIKNQTKKINEECFELIEAITEYESSFDWVGINFFENYEEYKKKYINHIAEELADCYVLLNQIKTYYGISDLQIEDIMDEKTERTLERIKSGYYDKKEEN